MWQKQGVRYNAFVRTPELLLVAGQTGSVNEGDKEGFVSLGAFEFAAGKAEVVIANEGTEGLSHSAATQTEKTSALR